MRKWFRESLEDPVVWLILTFLLTGLIMAGVLAWLG